MPAKKQETESSAVKRKRNGSKPRQDGWNGQRVYENEPIAGFYRVNVRIEGVGWVPVPARLRMVSGCRDDAGDLLEDEIFEAHVAGIPTPVEQFWPGKAKHRITEDEYNALCERNTRWQSLSTRQPLKS